MRRLPVRLSVRLQVLLVASLLLASGCSTSPTQEDIERNPPVPATNAPPPAS